MAMGSMVERTGKPMVEGKSFEVLAGSQDVRKNVETASEKRWSFF